MAGQDHHFQILLYGEDGRRLGQAVAEVDWRPALEDAWFRRLRTAGGKDTGAGPAAGRVSLVWHASAGPPFLAGFRVDGGVGADPAGDFVYGTDYFAGLASDAVGQLSEQNVLQKGESARFLVAAYPREDTDVPPLNGEELPRDLRLRNGSLAMFRGASAAAGDEEDGQLPVFVPDDVLMQALRLGEEATGRGVETGGVLIGHLRCDPVAPELFVQITAQVPCRHAVAGRDRLCFTAETWADARAAIGLRRREELLLGWWHSHPVRSWCPDCPQERLNGCSFAGSYFSRQDRLLHRTVFPLTYQVALVVNGCGLGATTLSAFGWRSGDIAQRGLRVTGGARACSHWHAPRLGTGNGGCEDEDDGR